jgi:CTP:molybdopterin cytidylyltransferase MocA
VVLGAHAEAVRAGVIERLAPPHPEVVVCPDWDSGMAHSLRFGLTALGAAPADPTAPKPAAASAAALVLLGDTPFVTAADLRRLIHAWQATPDTPATAEYDGTVGAPCILPRVVWPEVMQLHGDRGAGSWMRARSDDAQPLSIIQMATARFDVDYNIET